MRLKSFTLIEVMIASLIFVMVAVMAVAAFAAAKNSSDHSNDLRVTNECNQQISELLRAKIEAADIQKRFSGLVKKGDSFVLKNPTSSRYVGLAIFESESKFTPVYKDGENYYYTPSPVVVNPDPNHAYLFDFAKVTSDDCSAFLAKPVAGFSFSTPFAVAKLSYFNAGANPTNNEDIIYTINLHDIIFRKYNSGAVIADEQTSFDAGIYSEMNLNLVNSVRPL